MGSSANHSGQWLNRLAFGLAVALAAAAFGGPVLAAAADPFPEERPATRAQAIAFVRAEADSGTRCLTPGVDSLRRTPFGRSSSAGRIVDLLGRRIAFSRESTLFGPDGWVVRYTTEVSAFDRIDPTDANLDGVPDLVRAMRVGLEQARELLVERMQFPAPGPADVLLVELGDEIDGYVIPAQGGSSRPTLVLDATPREGENGARRAAIHQYAHATAFAASVPTAWAEALATWTNLAIDGQPSVETAALLDARLRQLSSGLLAAEGPLAAGNAIWFAFLHQNYGAGAVRATVEELARGSSVATALDRAVRRLSKDDLASAFREFQLWSVLVGDRSDGHHFSFAGVLGSPGFASESEGLPAVSVQADPGLAPLAATQIRLDPAADDGGLRIVFEGDFSGRWEADLLLVGDSGSLHRLPLSLSSEGRGEATVPLDGLSEALLLVRNLGDDEGETHRYTYSAVRDKSFPFEIQSLQATDHGDRGVLVSWETSSEQRLIGFNVLRFREGRVRPRAINPVWIPALGDSSRVTSYHFTDPSANPEVAYTYRIQGITADGLTSLSGPSATLAPRR